MPRFLTDDTFDDDPAVARAGTAAMGLYYRCGVYVAGHLLDGFVPSEIASQYGTPEWAKRLTDACLWETVPGGHYMPLYFSHGNPTREKVLAERKAKSERQQRWLDNRRNASSAQRRVSRPSTRQSDNATRDASKDAALPPSFQEGRPAARPPGAQRPAATGYAPPAAEVLAAGRPDGHRLARPEVVAKAAAAARQAMARKAGPP